MRILALYPGLAPCYDDVAEALPELVRRGCTVRVITSRISALKTVAPAAYREDFQGVEIHRIYRDVEHMRQHPPGPLAEAEGLARDFNPDLIFFNSPALYPLALFLGTSRGLPRVMRVERALDPEWFRRRDTLGLKPVGHLRAAFTWWQICGGVDSVITTDPLDLRRLDRIGWRGIPVYYAPHCNQLPDGFRPSSQRESTRMIFVGSLTRNKRCHRWLKRVPEIFDNTPVTDFTIIGTGPDQAVVDSLVRRFKTHIEHIPSLPRQEALGRLATAHFAYTESRTGAWGLKGDAWACRTPLVAPGSRYAAEPGWDTLKARNLADLMSGIRRLYEDTEFYEALQEGGHHRYLYRHTASIVAGHYYRAFKDTLHRIRA